ncbi:MAG TPA: hypothetical protein VGQ69_15810 [Gemmatimonadales bacterium]|jgi:hypothetical protein|nr:hypothetical protein [Gemmatimonadales bacterium]
MRIDGPSGIVLFQTQGSLAYEDWEREVRAALAATNGSLRHVLSDRRELPSDYELGVLEGAVDFFRSHAGELGDVQWGILVASASAVHRSANLAQVLAEATRIRIKVFTELRAALQWLLGVVDEEELERLERWVEGQG